MHARTHACIGRPSAFWGIWSVPLCQRLVRKRVPWPGKDSNHEHREDRRCFFERNPCRSRFVLRRDRPDARADAADCNPGYYQHDSIEPGRERILLDRKPGRDKQQYGKSRWSERRSLELDGGKKQFRNHSQDAGGIERGCKQRKLEARKRKFWDETSAGRNLARRRRRIDGNSKHGYHAKFCGQEFRSCCTPGVGNRGTGNSEFSW